jgi:hypothetical protein
MVITPLKYFVKINAMLFKNIQFVISTAGRYL